LPIEGVEWVIVAGVLLMVLLWDPERIPELARTMRRFMSEVQRMRSEAEEYLSEAIKPAEESAVSSDRQILEAARRLGIATEGLRRDEIIERINKRLDDLLKG